MRHYVLILFMVFLGTTFAAKPAIKWMDYNTALERARKDTTFVLVEVYTDWCMPCKIMAKTTFLDTAVIRSWNESFLAVKLNAESDQLINCNNWPRPVSSCVMEDWGVEGVPSFVLIGPSGQIALKISQAHDAEVLLVLLQDFRDNRAQLLARDRAAKEAPLDP